MIYCEGMPRSDGEKDAKMKKTEEGLIKGKKGKKVGGADCLKAGMTTLIPRLANQLTYLVRAS